jgi:hypothetical protein
MPFETSERYRTAPRYGEEWDTRSPRHSSWSERHSSSLVVTGLVVLGMGAVLWNYLGPDLRRYLKLRSM